MLIRSQEGGTFTVTVRSDYSTFSYVTVCTESVTWEPHAVVRLNVQASNDDQSTILLDPDEADELAAYLKSRAEWARGLIAEAEEENAA